MAIYKQDRFGNRQAVVALIDKRGNGYPRGFVKVGGKNYKVEYSESNKDGVDGWVSLTLVTRKSNKNNGGL